MLISFVARSARFVPGAVRRTCRQPRGPVSASQPTGLCSGLGGTGPLLLPSHFPETVSSISASRVCASLLCDPKVFADLVTIRWLLWERIICLSVSFVQTYNLVLGPGVNGSLKFPLLLFFFLSHVSMLKSARPGALLYRYLWLLII